MSRLAAVRTGQPTQGIGAAPALEPEFEQEQEPGQEPAESNGHASVLPAASAQAAPAHAAPAPPVAAPLRVNPRSPHSAAKTAVAAAWLLKEASEAQVRKHFRSEISKEAGLELLARMRSLCDMAAAELQNRIDESKRERCSGCGKTLEEAGRSMWLSQGSDLDSETGLPVPYYYCGPMCVRERNRGKMLPKELRDQKRFDGEDIADVR